LEIKKKDKMLRHPSDASQWNALNLEYPEFGDDPRNIRLGASTDGVNSTTKVRSGRVCTKYRRLPTMLRYSVASLAGVVLCLDSLKSGSMGTWNGLDLAIPSFFSSFRA
jgi:hypothetical protein